MSNAVSHASSSSSSSSASDEESETGFSTGTGTSTSSPSGDDTLAHAAFRPRRCVDPAVTTAADDEGKDRRLGGSGSVSSSGSGNEATTTEAEDGPSACRFPEEADNITSPLPPPPPPTARPHDVSGVSQPTAVVVVTSPPPPTAFTEPPTTLNLIRFIGDDDDEHEIVFEQRSTASSDDDLFGLSAWKVVAAPPMPMHHNDGTTKDLECGGGGGGVVAATTPPSRKRRRYRAVVWHPLRRPNWRRADNQGNAGGAPNGVVAAAVVVVGTEPSADNDNANDWDCANIMSIDETNGDIRFHPVTATTTVGATAAVSEAAEFVPPAKRLVSMRRLWRRTTIPPMSSSNDNDTENGDHNDSKRIRDCHSSDGEAVSPARTEPVEDDDEGSCGGGTPEHGDPPRHHSHRQKRVRFLAGGKEEDEDDDIEEPPVIARQRRQRRRLLFFGPSLPPEPQQQGMPVVLSRRIMLLALVVFAVTMILTTIGTSYYGAKLALREYNSNGNSISTSTPIPVANDVPGWNATALKYNATTTIGPSVDCGTGESLLQLIITFDFRPSQVGIFLRDSGANGSDIWHFAPLTFRSWTQQQRQNVFSICLPDDDAGTTYELEITDTAGNGLVSSSSSHQLLTNATLVPPHVWYGQWTLTYDSHVVAQYHGDCKVTVPLTATTLTTGCGDYCSCFYNISKIITKGGCNLHCDGSNTTAV